MKLCGGKYEFVMGKDGILRCLRHGDSWREFVGDNAVLALFRHAEELDSRSVPTKRSPSLCPECGKHGQLKIEVERNAYFKCTRCGIMEG